MSKYKVKLNGKDVEVNLLEKSGPTLKFEVSGNVYEVTVESALSTEASGGLNDSTESSSEKKELHAPMPGLITKISAKEKQEVTLNQPLLTIEAMKMENSIFSPVKGKIKKIHVKPGQEVKNQELLISFE